MNAFVVLASLLAVANAGIVSVHPAGEGRTTIQRAPAHDSASIEHHRLGGNFAYSTAEAHAYAKTTELLNTAVHPVAETTHVHQPAPIAHVQPAPIVKTHHAAEPIIGHQAVYAQQPIVGPVATHTEVHQPIVKTQHLVQTKPATAHITHTAPAVAAVGYAAAPAIAHAGYAAAPALAHGYAAAPALAHGYAAAPGLAHGYAAAPALAHY